MWTLYIGTIQCTYLIFQIFGAKKLWEQSSRNMSTWKSNRDLCRCRLRKRKKCWSCFFNQVFNAGFRLPFCANLQSSAKRIAKFAIKYVQKSAIIYSWWKPLPLFYNLSCTDLVMTRICDIFHSRFHCVQLEYTINKLTSVFRDI